MNDSAHILILEKLRMLLDKAAIAYRSYLDHGQTFFYARQLKECNSAILDLLTNDRNKLPFELKKDADALIEHIQIWSGKWEALAREIDHGPNDQFVFQNEHRFPREAADRLMREIEN